MSNANTVTLTGNVTRDPEIRIAPSNQMSVVKFGLAVNKSKRQADGSWEDVPHYFEVTCFGSLADNVTESVVKGTRVTVFGELEYSTWDDKETGDKRSKVAINAEDVAISLRWAKADVTKTNSSNTSGSGGSSKAADDEFWQ